ncbi:amidase domain-containing protein [Pseudoneobacillus sp. C159]
MRLQLQRLLEDRARQCVSDHPKSSEHKCPKIETKKTEAYKRSTEIVKAKATGKIFQKETNEDMMQVTYQVHFQYLMKQKNHLYLEEEIELRKAEFFKGTLVRDEEIKQSLSQLANDHREHTSPSNEDFDKRVPYRYDRLRAVQYAETWWNDYNPAFRKFPENDCTNFISQCLYAGGAPMRGYPNRGSGWWYRNNNYSWSWGIANTFKNYLSNSTTGLRTMEVSRPDQLILGDVICYDFEGDGRFNHNTIVTGRDYYGMPLVNAHTTNSRLRYWSYTDSTAYTPNIKYKFFTIIDDE